MKYLIINADDAGLSPEVDAGILETIRFGMVTSVSLLVNPPFETDIKSFIESGVSIGLHLNYTHGYSCSSFDTLREGDTGNTPLISFQKARVGQVEGFEEYSPQEVRAEFLNQLYRFRELVGHSPTHLDVHKHLHQRSMDVFSVVIEMAKDLNVFVRCLDGNMRNICRKAGVRTTDYFIGNVSPSPYWTVERLKEQLDGIPEGITEMMCHPGADVKTITDIWYIKERDIERRTLTSLMAKESLAPFRLVNFCNAPFESI